MKPAQKLFLIFFLALLFSSPALGDPNLFEQRKIKARALEAFETVVSLWKEELYFEMYDMGSKATKGRVNKEEFSQRMVNLSWIPKGELNPKYVKTVYKFRTMVHVSVRLQYRHKINTKEVFYRDHTFLMLQEKGAWTIDLIQVVRAPYS